jgi:ferrous iron transport protein A
MRTVRPLLDLLPGSRAVVSAIHAGTNLQRRLAAMGLRPGQTVLMLRRGWWSGPLHLRVGMTELMIRRRDAASIALEP